MRGFVSKMAIWFKAIIVDMYQSSAPVQYLKESRG